MSSFIDSAFAWGLGFGAATCGGFATLGVNAYLLDLVTLRRKKRTARRATEPASPIDDLVQWKRQRRLDDLTAWQDAFNALQPIRRSRGGHIQLVPRGYLKQDLRMLTDNYGNHRGKQLWLRGWDGAHHTTCPYECDCPQDIRSAAFHSVVS